MNEKNWTTRTTDALLLLGIHSDGEQETSTLQADSTLK